jgi:hypothetical protein
MIDQSVEITWTNPQTRRTPVVTLARAGLESRIPDYLTVRDMNRNIPGLFLKKRSSFGAIPHSSQPKWRSAGRMICMSREWIAWPTGDKDAGTNCLESVSVLL